MLASRSLHTERVCFIFLIFNFCFFELLILLRNGADIPEAMPAANATDRARVGVPQFDSQ